MIFSAEPPRRRTRRRELRNGPPPPPSWMVSSMVEENLEMTMQSVREELEKIKLSNKRNVDAESVEEPDSDSSEG